MKATLEFTLPEDRSEHHLAIHASDWWLVAWDLDQWLRSALKHGHNYDSADAALEGARDELHELIAARGVSLDDVE